MMAMSNETEKWDFSKDKEEYFKQYLYPEQQIPDMSNDWEGYIKYMRGVGNDAEL
jgi:hypothetical protein